MVLPLIFGWLPVVLPGPVMPAPTVMLTVQVQNRLHESRPATVELDLHQLNLLANPDRLRVRDQVSGQPFVTQLIDENDDQTWDKLLCRITLQATEKRLLTVEMIPAGTMPMSASVVAFSRFVPERIDDYAWENDLVAFRTYGPVAQQFTEAGRKDGTLTSGMDCWLKRVPFPVIDKWYAGNVKESGFYHKDHCEGYDPYHVGDSRGCGGIGIWNDADSTLAVSKNFVTYRRIAIGPIRTVFELTYAPWSANGQRLRERKRISLDAGDQLSRYEVFIETDRGAVPPVTVGITLHEQTGTAAGRPAEGWFRHWEPMDDSELGTGIVVLPQQVQNWWVFRTTRKDQSHVFVRLKPTLPFIYYAGYGWTKAGQFRRPADWETYLATQARWLASPVLVSVIKKRN